MSMSDYPFADGGPGGNLLGIGGPPNTQIQPDPTPPRPTPTPEPEEDTTEADVEALLASQFGGFSFFLQKNREDLMVGITEDGTVVSADDPGAVETKNVLDYIVDEGIVAPTRVKGILENTSWWQSTDKAMREFDTQWAEMSDPERAEFLEPVTDMLEKELKFLGASLSPEQMSKLAEDIMRFGEADDQEYIRGVLTAELKFDPTATPAASEFGAAADDMQILADKYFVPISDEAAQKFASQVYTGEKTAAEMEQYFKLMAKETFPALANAIDSGIAPSEYFETYKYEMSKMLGRPITNVYNEFPEVVQFTPPEGGPARPMNLYEVRQHIRGGSEWQRSKQGRDAARSLATEIGRVFGEVA